MLGSAQLSGPIDGAEYDHGFSSSVIVERAYQKLVDLERNTTKDKLHRAAYSSLRDLSARALESMGALRFSSETQTSMAAERCHGRLTRPWHLSQRLTMTSSARSWRHPRRSFVSASLLLLSGMPHREWLYVPATQCCTWRFVLVACSAGHCQLGRIALAPAAGL